MRRLLTVALLLVILGLSAWAVSCTKLPVYAPSPSFLNSTQIQYFYDETHDVSIWLISYGSGRAITVLPGSQVESPQRPAEIIKP